MDTIRVDKLNRNASKIRSYFKEVKDTTITTQDIDIVFPARFIDLRLAKVDGLVDLVGYYAILDTKDNYGVVIAPTIGTYTPSSVRYVIINNEKYICLSFNAGDTVLANNIMLANDTFMYDVFQDFFVKGNIPWYFNYEDVSNLILESSKYANSGIGNNPISTEIFAAVIARIPNNKKILYKDTLQKREDIFKRNPEYIGISDIRYSFDSTSSKIIGGYFKEGVINAVVDPETKTSKVAENLRH